ncbi:MAG: PD40 domain-containing protein [Armatimonadetes bacterium]|nr:PD40 domain-containing protein [Armatimonadota bacterium]
MGSRSAYALVAVAIIAGAWVLLKRHGEDIDLGAVESKDWLVAVKSANRGSQVVVLKPQGDSYGDPVVAPGYDDSKHSVHDEDPVWRPDGNRIFFASDREDGTKNIYRWNLSTNVVMRRTVGRVPRTKPSFSVEESDRDSTDPLFVAGGLVRQLNVAEGTSIQKVPPVASKKDGGDSQVDENSGEGHGEYGQGAQLRIREARYFGKNEFIAFIRDTDEVQLLQVLNLKNPGPQALTLTSGDHIEITVNPATGALVYAISGFRWPDEKSVPKEFIKNGKATKPFENAVFVFDPQHVNPQFPAGDSIVASPDPKQAFMEPAVSFDGRSVILTYGAYEGAGELTRKNLLVMPCQSQGGRNYSSTAKGEVGNAAWSRDGKHIFYLVQEGKDRPIYRADADGKNAKRITKDGVYLSVFASPQG